MPLWLIDVGIFVFGLFACWRAWRFNPPDWQPLMVFPRLLSIGAMVLITAGEVLTLMKAPHASTILGLVGALLGVAGFSVLVVRTRHAQKARKRAHQP